MNQKLFRFLFFGLDSKDVVSRIIGLERLRKIKKKFTKKDHATFNIDGLGSMYKDLVSNTKSDWKPLHDYLLCKGILTHGFGSWEEIAGDKNVWLKKEGREGVPAQTSFEKLTKIIAPKKIIDPVKDKEKGMAFIRGYLRYRGVSLLQCLLKMQQGYK